MIVGATPGKGSDNLHATPDVAGLKAYQQKTGTYPACMKLFPTVTDIASWNGLSANARNMLANNNGKPIFFIIPLGGTAPTAAKLQTFFASLKPGQRVGFVWESEAEHGPAVPATTFLAQFHALSNNLNTALAYMAQHPVTGNASTFYTRQTFPTMTSAYMAYYATKPGSTAFIPPPSDCDWYGADLYHKGSSTNKVLTSDPRYAGFLKAVTAKAGTSAKLALPEYGIDLAGVGGDDSKRAAIMKADMTALGSRMQLWNYWFEVGDSGQQYLFSQPGPTATQWKTIAGQ